MAANQTWQPLERDALAARLARDIPEGWSVNLGIGIVVPAEKILETLNHPDLVQMRKDTEEAIRLGRIPRLDSTVVEE